MAAAKLIRFRSRPSGTNHAPAAAAAPSMSMITMKRNIECHSRFAVWRRDVLHRPLRAGDHQLVRTLNDLESGRRVAAGGSHRPTGTFSHAMRRTQPRRVAGQVQFITDEKLAGPKRRQAGCTILDSALWIGAIRSQERRQGCSLPLDAGAEIAMRSCTGVSAVVNRCFECVLASRSRGSKRYTPDACKQHDCCQSNHRAATDPTLRLEKPRPGM